MKCKHCKRNTKNNKFCSSSCSASYNNIGKQRNIKTGRYAIKNCLFCGKPTTNIKYCSMKCSENNRKVEVKKDISELHSDRSRREWLIFHNGLKCSKCKRTKWNKKKYTN